MVCVVMHGSVFALVGNAMRGLGLHGKTFHILLESESRALCEISRAKGRGDISVPLCSLGRGA